MAVLSGFPQNVTYQSVTVAQGGGSENLLINPRGKINQANESAGVLAAGQYFCDGWKAGAAGAEVYIDSDGFRLVSGSILQLVPNNLESGRSIRGNMDVLMGNPVISINGGSDNELSDSAEYIQFEVSGNNSKFTRLVLAESVGIPIYQQLADELTSCKKFWQEYGNMGNPYPLILNMHTNTNSQYGSMALVPEMHDVPAVSVIESTQNIGSIFSSKKTLCIGASNSTGMALVHFILDARP